MTDTSSRSNPKSNLIKVLPVPLISLFLLIFIGYGFIAVHSQSKDAVEEAAALDAPGQTTVPCCAQSAHVLVGSYYTTENNLDAKLLLNNKGVEELEVQPTLYNLQGQELQLPSVTVEAHSFRFINLKEWADIGGAGYQSGNIKLIHGGSDLVLGAQIYLTDRDHSLSFEEKLVERGTFDSQRQETVWWMPSKQAEVTVLLTNTTDEPLNVTAQLTGKQPLTGNPQSYELAAHETKKLDLAHDFTAGSQFIQSGLLGLSLAHQSSSKDALLARVLVNEKSRGYSSFAQFSNPGGGKSSEYQGAGFQIEDVNNANLTPIIVARNVGTERTIVTVKVPYTRVDGSDGLITLPQEVIQPGRLAEINAQKIVQRAKQEQISVASVEIQYSTAPGTVVVGVQTVSEDHNLVFRVPMWDPFVQRSPTGGYPWRIDATSQTEVYIKSITDVEEDYVAYLLWENGGVYMIGLNSIGAHKTVKIDIKKLRDEQIPDERGNTIPPEVSSGQIQWTMRRKDNLPADDRRSNLALIGRSEQVDLTNGIITSYACVNCCFGSYVSATVEQSPSPSPSPSPSTSSVVVGGTVQFVAVEKQSTCYGNVSGTEFNQRTATWSSSNTSIATVSTTGLVTGVAFGSTSIQATWQARAYTVINHVCVQVQMFNVTAARTILVRPSISSLRATLPSTDSNAADGEFQTENSELAFATSSTDLMVVFKGGDGITVSAQGINPSTAGSLLKWKVERDPADTLETGLPSLSSTSGSSTVITPSKAGNFRLINYYDTNSNGTFEAGEELKVLRFAVARINLSTSNCTISTTNDFVGQASGSNFTVKTLDPISIGCSVGLGSGGSSGTIGLDKVQMGSVGNLTSESLAVTYTVGEAMENTGGGGILPKVVTDASILNGGATIFRASSNSNGSPNGKRITSDDTPNLGPFLIQHPGQDNGTFWSLTSGGLIFNEFIVAYSETFPKYYVVAAKAGLQVDFGGSRNENGEWVRGNAIVFLQGSQQEEADFTPTGDGTGSITSGRSVGLTVSGTSYDGSAFYEYTQP